MEHQQTIRKSVTLSGRGLFGGQPVNVRFEPAPPNHGVVFCRTDLGGLRVPALIDNVARHDRRTTLRSGDATVETCEHCMSALAALNIDNVLIEMDAAELPAGDGSARPFHDILMRAEPVEQEDAPRQVYKVTEPIVVRDGDATLAAVPCEEATMQVVYELDYARHGVIGRQIHTFDCGNGNYAEQLAPARTFLLQQEVEAMHRAGFGSHLSEKDVLVIGPAGPVGNRFRFQDEPVRHKVVDLIGDLYLLGAPIHGRIIAHRSGHALNHALVRELVRHHRGQTRRRLAHRDTAIDIRKLMQILPHRYPMLLIDRVISIEAEKRIVGLKNVTINEPFFQGHYPGTPVMPGVLLVEAMAQLSGVLIGQKLEHTGKLGILMSLDRVKIRRPVTPGDQLIIEAVAIRVRSRIAHTSCKAFVGDDLAAEAEIKFMLVDEEQE